MTARHSEQHGGLRKVHPIPADEAHRAGLVRQMVAVAFGIPPQELEAPTRRRAPVAFARQVAMYLAHVAYSMPLSRVGAAFGRDRTTASHACQVVEDRRDDPALDAVLTRLEQGLRSVPRAGGLLGRAPGHAG